MLHRLKQRWKVNTLNLTLIICTFALGGSLCGYLARKLLAFSSLEKGVFWVMSYILLMTILWPLCVLLISIPLGQFVFFKKYLFKIWARLSQKKKINIAIFASGGGSNAEKIITYFKNHSTIQVVVVYCNVPTAGVITIAKNNQIPVVLIEKNHFNQTNKYIDLLHQQQIDCIVLAGFLLKIPDTMVHAFPNKIINIHPALLPKFGGKGMYGKHVHEAVIAAKEKQSGITIHYVDEHYDHGSTIFTITCNIVDTDTADLLAKKVLALEHQHFAPTIEKVLLKM
jgi:formyltetrahydrofolate-dependent phosphoribosylglycinamide formyltransferase